MRVTLRLATSTDALRIAQLLIDERSRFMPYAPAANSDDEIRSWVKTLLLPTSDTVVAEANRQLPGVMVTTRESECSWIKQMAVDPNYVGRGIGSTLISYAFSVLPSPIRLYTFQANTAARRFYERYGFRAIQFTDGRANEERCPDVLYDFSSPGTGSGPTTLGT